MSGPVKTRGLPPSVVSGVSLATVTSQSRKQDRAANTISPGGSICWFNGPSVIDYKGTRTCRYVGFVQADGGVVVAQQDLTTGVVTQFNLHAAFAIAGGGTGTSNDHASPALVVRPDGRLIVFYAQQGNSPIYYRISTNPEDISAWGAEQTMSGVGASATYPHPHYIGTRLFLFYVSSPEQRIVYSDDNGATWSTPRLFQTSTPYGGMYLSIRDNGPAIGGTPTRLDWIISEHPNASTASEPALSSMYHGYFDGTTFRDSAGTAITTLAALPVIADPNNYTHARTDTVLYTSMTKVYDYATNGLCWAWDVAYDSVGNPVCVFASFPGAAIGDDWATVPSHFTDHRYNYYRWNGAWAGAQIVAGGTKIGDDYIGFQEYQYSGGIALVQSDPTVVYLSRQVVGVVKQFEIERWVTTDGYGASWTSSPVTFESDARTKNIRPFTPYNQVPGSSDVIWQSGSYWDYTIFSTVIALSAPPSLAQSRTALQARPSGSGLSDALLAPAAALSPSLLLALSANLTDSSANGYQVNAAALPTFGKGRYGDKQAIIFDGATQALSSLYAPYTPNTVRTFFGWYNRANHAANHQLLGGLADGYGTPAPLLRLNTGGHNIVWTPRSDVAVVTWTAASPGDSQWVSWALIFDDPADTVELYVNGVSKGVLVNAAQFQLNHNSVPFPLTIGATGITTGGIISPFNGSMANVGVYEGRLTATQIGQLAGAVTGSCAGNAAVKNALTQLAAEGLIGVDSTTLDTVPSARKDLVVKTRGIVSETADFALVNSANTAALTSGTLVGGLAGFMAGESVTGIDIYSDIAQATANASLVKVALLDKTGKVLAVSADFSASLAANVNSIPFTPGAYVIPASDAYYICLLMVFAGTAPKGLWVGNASVMGVAYHGAKRELVVESGLSDFASIGGTMALAAGSRSYWLAAY